MTLPRPDGYSGFITDEIRAAAPEFHELVRGAGQPVTVHSRAGLPDADTIAFIWQEDAGNVQDNTFQVLGWQAFFIPAEAAALRGREWYLTDSQGRTFIPDADVQDIGEQGVLMWAHLLPTPERARVYLLTFEMAAGGLTENADGQFETGTDELFIAVRLSASTDPRIRDTVGADSAEVVLVGRWGTLVSPQTRPDGVGWGDSAALTLDGQPGVLTVQLAYPDDDLATQTVFGARFLAIWRAASPV